jgi:hypothetical protein
LKDNLKPLTLSNEGRPPRGIYATNQNSVTYRDELIRIFSARDAEPDEIEEYNNGVKSILG